MKYKILSFAVILLMLLNVTSVYADASDFLNATIKISICGNGIIEGGEDCEGVNLNGQTCISSGYGPGILTCDIACSFDTYGCAPKPTPTQTPTPTLTSTPTPTLKPAAAATEVPPTKVNPTSPLPTKILVSSSLPRFFTLAPREVNRAALMPSAFPTAKPAKDKPFLVVATLPFDAAEGENRASVLPPVLKSFLEETAMFETKVIPRNSVLKIESRAALVKLLAKWAALRKKKPAPKTKLKCDFNDDGKCTVKDLSIMFHFVQK